jgi:EAL domain-containing protein (putative c-di-GMP-specific phosphodiesterase class I)
MHDPTDPAGRTEDIAMAFQPIVDLVRGEIFAYEALVRPAPNGDAHAGCASDVFSRIEGPRLGAFDEQCRALAIHTAARLGFDGFLALNFMPEALDDPRASLRRSLEVAAARRIGAHRLILEVTGGAASLDSGWLRGVLADYRTEGVVTAIDDFGAGHGSLTLLADCQPDLVKLDIRLIRGIHRDRARRAVVRAVMTMCADLGISLIAEGVEDVAEAYELRELDVRLFQGNLFGRPEVGLLPQPNFAVMDQLTGQHAALRLLETGRG